VRKAGARAETTRDETRRGEVEDGVDALADAEEWF